MGKKPGSVRRRLGGPSSSANILMWAPSRRRKRHGKSTNEPGVWDLAPLWTPSLNPSKIVFLSQILHT
jgi:hypothetical protein